jgi:hypothetical protein
VLPPSGLPEFEIIETLQLTTDSIRETSLPARSCRKPSAPAAWLQLLKLK